MYRLYLERRLTFDNIMHGTRELEEIGPLWKSKAFLKQVQKLLIIFLLLIMLGTIAAVKIIIFLGSTILSVVPTKNSAEEGYGSLHAVAAGSEYI